MALARSARLVMLVALVASAAGAHMTGSVLTVDGGHSINSL